jgi:Outer membrane protein beta-barrel domain
MKRILVAVAMVPALARAADVTPGTLALSGFSNLELSWSSSKSGSSPSTDTTSYGLVASGLYYAMPNVGFGLDAGYSRVETKLSGASQTTKSATIGPAVELDIPQTEQASFFTRASIGYTSATFSDPFGGGLTLSGWAATAALGAKYFVVKSFSIDAAVAYSYTRLTGERSAFGSSPELTASAFGLNVGLSVYFLR